MLIVSYASYIPLRGPHSFTASLMYGFIHSWLHFFMASLFYDFILLWLHFSLALFFYDFIIFMASFFCGFIHAVAMIQDVVSHHISCHELFITYHL